MGSKGKIVYHIVTSTKYRRKCLLGLESDVYKSVERAAKSGGFKVLECAVDKGDHLHIVVESKQALSPKEVVSRVKQVTTFDLWEAHASHLKTFFWKGRRVLWAGGYYCASVGAVSTSTVLNYVRAQRVE